MPSRLRIRIDRILRSEEIERHRCNWPTCDRQVLPVMWACPGHWRILPRHLRDALWLTYPVGSTIRYLKVVAQVEKWIGKFRAKHRKEYVYDYGTIPSGSNKAYRVQEP